VIATNRTAGSSGIVPLSLVAAPATAERPLLELLPSVPPRPLPAYLSPRRTPAPHPIVRATRSAWLHVMDPGAAPEPGAGVVVGSCLAALLIAVYTVVQILTGGAR